MLYLACKCELTISFITGAIHESNYDAHRAGKVRNLLVNFSDKTLSAEKKAAAAEDDDDEGNREREGRVGAVKQTEHSTDDVHATVQKCSCSLQGSQLNVLSLFFV